MWYDCTTRIFGSRLANNKLLLTDKFNSKEVALATQYKYNWQATIFISARYVALDF